MALTVRDICEFLLCIFLPPLAVFIHANDCNCNVLINILLCILGWIPGMIHAFWYCFCT